MARIVSIGAALQDVYLIDHDDFGTNSRGFFNQIELGTKVDIDKIKFGTGGGATNAATTFARYGHESIFMGCIANDPAGQAIINSLDDEGIDSSYVTYLDKCQTGYSVVLLAPSGERTILTCRGASAHFNSLNPDDLDTIYPDWVYVTTFRGDMDMLDQFFTKAKSLGAKIMFNPGNLELEHTRKLLGLLSDVDVLLVNKKEAKEIVEGHVLTELVSKLKNYVPYVIVTDGNQGAIAADGKEIYRAGLYEDVKIKDSTGAGDAFGSGFLTAFADGKSFKDSLIFASANSTSVVQHIGSKDGILNKHAKLHNMPIEEVR
ncbi:MAG: carbohydrate kinase family protein [Candidatus Saccharibacteria bacterium]|nr:carbohydrate kinase family protein [Candidatus Saccharibacteria bacterium]